MKWPGISRPPDRSKIPCGVNHGTSENRGFRKPCARWWKRIIRCSKPLKSWGLARQRCVAESRPGASVKRRCLPPWPLDDFSSIIAGAVEGFRRSAFHPGPRARPAKKRPEPLLLLGLPAFVGLRWSLKWWRWRESNPRPKVLNARIYMLSPTFDLVPRQARWARRTAEPA